MTTAKILVQQLKMLYYLEHQPPESPNDNMDAFRSLRDSKEVWNAFKQESTPAEYATVELIWEAYECRCQLTSDKVQILAESLPERISFDGLEADDISWEPLHATLLTVRVILSYHCYLKIGLSSSPLSRLRLPCHQR